MTQERRWASRDSRDGGPARLPARILGSRLGRQLATGLLVVMASGILALAIVDARFLPLFIPPVALAGLWAVGRFPFAALCAVLALSATVISVTRFKVPVGPLDLRLTEIILGALLLIALVRPRRNWWGGFAGGALAVFFALLASAAIYAVSSGRAEPVDAYQYTRSLAPLLVFFAIVRLFPDLEHARRLIYVAAAMAAVTGVVSLLAAAPGSPVSAFLDPSGAANGDTAPSSTTSMGLVNRVRLPGVALAYVLFWYGVLRTMRAEKMQRLPWLAISGGMAIALALSFNRNMWVGLALGLVTVFILTHTRARRQIIVGLLILVAIGTLAALSGARVPPDSPIYPVVTRFATLFQPDEQVQDSSLTDRFNENRHALQTIRDHPLTGVGPGAPFGLTAVENLGNQVFLRENALFVHNQYLHLLLIGGPLLLLSFIGFLLAPIVTGLRRMRHDHLFVALTAAIAMTLLSAIVMLSFVDPTWTAVLGLLVGVLAVLTAQPFGSKDASGVEM